MPGIAIMLRVFVAVVWQHNTAFASLCVVKGLRLVLLGRLGIDLVNAFKCIMGVDISRCAFCTGHDCMLWLVMYSRPFLCPLLGSHVDYLEPVTHSYGVRAALPLSWTCDGVTVHTAEWTQLCGVCVAA